MNLRKGRPVPKSARRAPRRRAATPARREARDTRPLLDRILDTPHLAQIVPRLQPEMLHRVIQKCGLEDCGELVSLATPNQLAAVFDLDLWGAGRPSLDEQFDAVRFGLWLEVLMESGASVAARTVSKMDADLVIAALSQHARVFDPASVSSAESGCDIGGYLVVATRTDSWDAIAAVLAALGDEHHDYFHRVMSGSRRLSNAGFELDGLDDLLGDRDQVLFDLAVDREQRREQQGYVTPAQARAFLQMSRQLPLGRNTTPPNNPVARAYFRAIESATEPEAQPGTGHPPADSATPLAPENTADAVAAFADVLLEAGVLPQQPRALLDGPREGRPSRLARIQAQLQAAGETDPAAYAMRSQELAYLANTIVAGCSIQGRPFTAQEASDAAVAVCNLGLEHWPLHWLPADARRGRSAADGATVLPDHFLAGQDLVGVFQVGWAVLYEHVCMYTAGRLVEIVTRLPSDVLEVHAGLDDLRLELARHWQDGAPWRARDDLDALAILDMPAWATVLGLIDECPVIHAAMGASTRAGTLAVSASAFEFISETTQIGSIRDWMESMPEILRR